MIPPRPREALTRPPGPSRRRDTASPKTACPARHPSALTG
ncbi:hypothetical protein STRAU_0348 [Streptomyces aurantiacus JA 4570]|uniref:Uncharacterized protein n=1 Tax=Streptomyces aurantiacus JA 4570 TaxID=1286094 RepID=S3ZV24_9ACTN|nr:hypothetical protein STRAU_0348 [Streptomyces aurantiacus JA 4570]